MPIPDGTKIGVSTETPSLYFDSFLIAFVVSINNRINIIYSFIFSQSQIIFFREMAIKAVPIRQQAQRSSLLESLFRLSTIPGKG
jgi:hypothetical protein